MEASIKFASPGSQLGILEIFPQTFATWFESLQNFVNSRVLFQVGRITEWIEKFPAAFAFGKVLNEVNAFDGMQ